MNKILRNFILLTAASLVGGLRTSDAQTQTPNYQFNTPVRSSPDWNIPLNANFVKLDNILSGTTGLVSGFWNNNTASNSKVGGVMLSAGSTNTTAENASNRGVANGYAPLGSDGLVPSGDLPALTFTAVVNAWTTGGSCTLGYLKFDGSCSVPAGGISTITGDGSASGTGSVALTVTGIRGHSVASGSLGTHQILISDDGTTWTHRVGTLDDLGPAFNILSFGGAQKVEIGANIVNPGFTASYSSTPTSASITNTDGTSSPTNLTTPFTSVTVTGTFVKATATCTTFTLTGIGTSTKTQNTTLCWAPRVFFGVGDAGASGSVTASGTTAVLSTSDVLASAGLDNQSTFGPFTGSGKKIYILMIGNTHTFVDASTGFAVPFLTPTAVSLVNANGDTVSMYLYESQNATFVTTSLKLNS